ncbi:MAG: ammonium transporter [Candidatus Nezhaarchaeota archaeon]|nr:ammonium transporter [Candidatus Nezhaarchaeota archaeon]
METTISPGDTTWILLSSALVFLMTPGLGFFYGGLVRKKNMANTVAACFAIAIVISLLWVSFGYSLAFGPDRFGIIGGLEWLGLSNVGSQPSSYAPTIPHSAFMLFQAMFAIITPALVIGAVVERIKFKALLLFTALWSTFVYVPIAHWVWAEGGWLRSLGAIDFAGGTVVHVNAGFAALIAALVLGKRVGYGNSSFEPSSVIYVLLGTAMLWLGWFGFNAGSALSSNSLAVHAFVTTNTAAAAAGATQMILSLVSRGKASIVTLSGGIVAGLVAITPAAGFVSVMNSMIIGAAAGVLCYFAVLLRTRLGIDDSLDVWGIHGVGGLCGALSVGILAEPSVNGAAGLLFGNPGQLIAQMASVAVTAAYSSALTWLILKLISKTIGLRVDRQEEMWGLDLTQHGELAWG